MFKFLCDLLVFNLKCCIVLWLEKPSFVQGLLDLELKKKTSFLKYSYKTTWPVLTPSNHNIVIPYIL